MPVVSQAQNAAMQAAAEGRSALGIPASVGAEFVKGERPGSIKKLPPRGAPATKEAKMRKPFGSFAP